MADAEDFSALPLSERWVHKVWKVRKEAYDEAKDVFTKAPNANDPTVKEFTSDASLWAKAVADANVAAATSALAALCAFLGIADTTGCTR